MTANAHLGIPQCTLIIFCVVFRYNVLTVLTTLAGHFSRRLLAVGTIYYALGL